MVLRVIAKIAAGVFVGGLLGGIITGDETYVAVWGIALPAFIFATIFGGLHAAGRMSGQGLLALARIDTIQRTGLEVNGSQECELRLVVAPQKLPAYATTVRLHIATDDLRKYVPGTILVVARRSLASPEVTIVPAPPAEWGALADAVRRDPSRIPVAFAAPDWTPTGPSQAIRRPRAWERVVSLLIVLGAAAVTLIPAYGMIGRTVSTIAAGDWDGNNLVTGRYQQVAVDEIAAVAGSYQFTNVNFYPDYVIVTALTAPTATTTDAYYFRYGRAFRDGPSSSQPTELPEQLFDASQLDFSQVAVAVQAALDRSDIDDIDSTYAFVSRGAEEMEISVYISGPYASEYLIYDFDGTLIAQP